MMCVPMHATARTLIDLDKGVRSSWLALGSASQIHSTINCLASGDNCGSGMSSCGVMDRGSMLFEKTVCGFETDLKIENKNQHFSR